MEISCAVPNKEVTNLEFHYYKKLVNPFQSRRCSIGSKLTFLDPSVAIAFIRMSAPPQPLPLPIVAVNTAH